MWVNCFHGLCQLLCNWIWVNTIFKNNHSQMIYKTVVFKDLQNLQDPRHVDFSSGVFLQILASGFFSQWTKLKGDSSSGVSLQLLWIFYRTLFDNCFWIFSSELIETCFFFSIFEYAVLQLSNLMSIINFVIRKIHFAKLTRVSFLMKLHVKGLQIVPFETESKKA